LKLGPVRLKLTAAHRFCWLCSERLERGRPR
jgi:hypothetical protein